MNYDLTPDDDAARLQSALLREISEPASGESPAWWFCVIVIAAFSAAVIWVTR